MAVTLNDLFGRAAWLTAFVVAAGTWAAFDNLFTISEETRGKAATSVGDELLLKQPVTYGNVGWPQHAMAVLQQVTGWMCCLTVGCGSATDMQPVLHAYDMYIVHGNTVQTAKLRSKQQVRQAATYFLHCQPSSFAALCFPGFATCKTYIGDQYVHLSRTIEFNMHV